MEAIIRPSAADAAAETIDFIKSKKIKFGKNKFVEPNKKIKIKFKYFAIPILFAIYFCCLFFLEKEYKIKGMVNISGNTQLRINFLDQDKSLNSVLSEPSGRYEIKLKKGYYKIYFEKDVPEKFISPKTSPFFIKLDRDLDNINIYTK